MDRLATGSHDLPVSPALAAFMRTRWATPPPPSTPAAVVAPYAAARRAALAERFPGERLVVPAGPPKVRSNDCDHRYRPHTAYAHLTGDATADTGPGAVLVLEPVGGGHEAVLYRQPPSGRDGDAFFRDRRHGEFWVGARETLAGTERRLGLVCRPLDALPGALRLSVPARVMLGVEPAVDAAVPVKDPALMNRDRKSVV